MTYKEIIHKLITWAESVRANVLYDLNFKVDSSEFFKQKFAKDRMDEKRLCNFLYKKVS